MIWIWKKPKCMYTVNYFITIQVIKKLNSSQTYISKWGSLLSYESKNYIPQISSKSLLSLFVNSNLGFYDSIKDLAPKKANLDSHNTLDQMFILKKK